MNPRIAGLIAVAGAVALGAAGYLMGTQSGGPSQAETTAAIEAYLEAHPEILASEETTAPAPAAPAPVTPAPAAPIASTPLTETQVAAVREIIRDHLIANPEIVRDAIDELQRKTEEAEAAAQVATISNDKERLFSSPRQVVLGNPQGDVTLVEFFDYNCGYCKRAHADMKRLIEEDKNLRFVLKEFPVLGDGSVEAAHVGAAVNLIASDKYFAFHDALIAERGQVNGARALAVAEELGLDVAKLREAMGSDEVKNTIAEVYDLANKLSLTGTPSYVTPREVVVGAVGYDALKASIEEVRACATTGC
jgi:protein-disulfide isomerase